MKLREHMFCIEIEINNLKIRITLSMIIFCKIIYLIFESTINELREHTFCIENLLDF